MKKTIQLTILIAFLTLPIWGQSYTVMTFNIRYDNPADGPDNWNHRKNDMLSFIQHLNPGIFGIQEGQLHQVEYLDKGLKNYQYFGVGRDDGKTKGEFCAIYYHLGQLELLKSGTFWLSETPDTVSIGWDAALERICTFGLFEDKDTSQKFWVFNTHFDHRGVLAREQSAMLIAEQIQAINFEQYPVVLMGDFNALAKEKPIQILNTYFDDTRQKSKQPARGPNGTFNGFKSTDNQRRIDYIFSTGFSVSLHRHEVARTSDGRFLSDHLPVIAVLNPYK